MGVCSFDHDPDLSALDAPPIWSPNWSPATLVLTLADPGPPRAFAIPADGVTRIVEHPKGIAIVMDDDRGRHYLWTDDPRALERPVAKILFDDVNPLRQAVVDRLWRWCASGRSSPLPGRLRLTPARLGRLIHQLHALDFYQNGAKPKEIAVRMLDRDTARLPAIDWKSSALRRQVMRLLAEAEALMNGGYRDLLRGH